MEIANQFLGNTRDRSIRLATRSDAAEIMKLLQTAVYRHLHVDWYLPGDWIGNPGFIVISRPHQHSSKSNLTKLFGPRDAIDGCLAVTADPLPAAWVRVVGLGDEETAPKDLAGMMHLAVESLRKNRVNAIAWLATEAWPNPWLPAMGFKEVNQIETYIKEDEALPDVDINPAIDIRPVLDSDLEPLARIEAAAFNTLWRHSAQGLSLARQQAYSFDVALKEGKIVGFQLSTASEYGVHLVRMTVHPDYQQTGIGSALLAHAFKGYHRRGRFRVTLNTQVNNVPSQKLYFKFGFRASGQRYPVWAMRI